MSSNISSSAFDLENLVHLEQTFFDTGYTDGYACGCTHGRIQGRALGREKGYQMWEEIGFYEGFAKVWQAICQTDDGIARTTKNRSESHIRHLLELVSQFPRVNPSAPPKGRDSLEDAELDIAELLSKIRARYKALCATLGVKPRFLPVRSGAITRNFRVEGRRNVWRLEGQQGPANPVEIGF